MSSPLERETLLVAKDYVGFCTGIRQDPPSESAKAMRQLAKQTERQHRSTFQTLVQNFLDNSEPDFLTSLKQTMAALAHDGQLNWGRVVALFAFAGMLASELSSRGVDVSNRRLAETIARYLSEEHGEWLLHNGGWAKNSQSKDPRGSLLGRRRAAIPAMLTTETAKKAFCRNDPKSTPLTMRKKERKPTYTRDKQNAKAQNRLEHIYTLFQHLIASAALFPLHIGTWKTILFT
uniref:Bcl-2 Bcl-2 homology region 1-3 domain-containing protein n=2 Tax=Scleropages formosus TaxID=113540 RepID=A0A8C9TV46_SCLFO